MTSLKRVLIGAVLITLCACSAPSPEGSQNSTGTLYLENKGSDTMVNLALAWAETYQEEHPEIRISVSGGGSGTGLAALINGTVHIANASRAIKSEEREKAAENGISPYETIVAKDAIAIIVNRENPINQLTLQQISDIYSGVYQNWKELGGADRPIIRLSRETNSGTHVYFLETVLRLGDKENKTLFSMDTLLLPSSEGITAEVVDNPNAIGYDGLGYIIPEVKIIAVAKDDQSEFVLPSAVTVNNNSYPIARDLYMYTDGVPTGSVKTYMDWITQPEAQQIVTNLGFVPILNRESGSQ